MKTVWTMSAPKSEEKKHWEKNSNSKLWRWFERCLPRPQPRKNISSSTCSHLRVCSGSASHSVPVLCTGTHLGTPCTLPRWPRRARPRTGRSGDRPASDFKPPFIAFEIRHHHTSPSLKSRTDRRNLRKLAANFPRASNKYISVPGR